MRTLVATTALTILFLSAGAFDGNNPPVAATQAVDTANVTVIAKNEAWPLKGMITVESCKTVRCMNI